MRFIRRSQHTRYCILVLKRHYFIRFPAGVMTRICPMQALADSFHRRKPSRVFVIDSKDLDVPSKTTMMSFLNMILSGRAVSIKKRSVEQLVVLLDYMGCNDPSIWNLVAQSIRFDAFDPVFLDTLQTIASWCDYRWIANLAASSKHSIPLHVFASGTILHEALLCMMAERNPCDIRDDTLDSKPVNLDEAFPGWKLNTVMQHTSFVTGAIAGGAVSGLLAGFQGSDIDLFLWNMTYANLYHFVKTIKKIHPTVACFVTQSNITFTLEDVSTPLQVIPMKDPLSGCGLVHFFDLDPCCCYIPWGYESTNIYIHPRAKWALASHSMDLRNANRRLSQQRVIKYEDRGFKQAIHPSAIFVRLRDSNPSEYPDPLPVRPRISLYEMKILDNWFQLEVDYGDLVQHVIKRAWTQKIDAVFTLIYKPWCVGLHGTPIVLFCSKKFKSCITGYQIVFGVTHQ